MDKMEGKLIISPFFMLSIEQFYLKLIIFINLSVTRSYYQIISLIKQSGYRIVEERRQYKMPKGLLPIKMFCLKPEENCTKNQ